MSRDRQCCDGRCLQGRDCPMRQVVSVRPIRLAPGVIDGPHRPRRGVLGRACDRLGRAGAFVAQIVWKACR